MSDLDDLPPEQRRLATTLRARLRASEELDYVSRSRLAAARARALEAATPRPATWMLATGGLAAAAILAVLLVLPPREASTLPASDTLDLLTDELEPEFYEDLDLYRWLEEDGAGHA